MGTVRSSGTPLRNLSRLSDVLILCLLSLTLSCAAEQRVTLHSDSGWQPWQILETQTGRVLPFQEWAKNLEQRDIVYLGEEHHNPYHIEAALKILHQFVSDGIEPTIAMEMFGWDGQPALDDYVTSVQPITNEFLEQVRWKQNWGGAFADYAPLVTFAKDRHLSVRAMNPPKPFIRRIVKFGLEQVKQDPEWTTLGMNGEEIVDDPAYRARIVDQLQRCHGGTEEHFRTMYEASMVRDESMAKTLVIRQEELRRERDGNRQLIVSYTGGGHIQYNLPVPKRVARRLRGDIKQTTIYMMSFESSRADDVRALMREGIADYIWLTPMGKPQSAQHCR
jgi:uncharacterized iron-regulated protein